MRPDFSRSIYLLGSAETGHLARVSLAADGTVHGHDAPCRARYGLQGERFYFLNQEGQKQARLRYHAAANGFFPDDASGLYLLPLLTLDPVREVGGNARLMINTIPKSGTYLLDLLLAEIGYQGLGLHLINRELHDNRGVAPQLIHRDPFSRRVFVPPSAIAPLMAPGEFAVGHVSDEAQLRQIDQAGVKIINCQRDLRDVLASLYRFKRKSVDPVSPQDRLWRKIEGADGFLAFLCHYAEGEIADLRQFAELMPTLPWVRLRFEDLSNASIPEAERNALDLLDENLGIMMEAILPVCLGRESSTLNAQKSNWRNLWSAAAEDFYVRSGLQDANKALGYN